MKNRRKQKQKNGNSYIFRICFDMFENKSVLVRHITYFYVM